MNDVPPPGELHGLALEKMSRVLGAQKAQQLMDRILAQLGLEILTAQDLYVFANHLSQLGGFESAVGSMLGVTAILRGARPPEEKSP